MKKYKKLLTTLGVTLVLVFLVSGINVMQNGFGSENLDPEKILNKALIDVTREDVLKLSKSDFVQLFYALPAPAIDELNGEYKAVNLPAGIMAASVQFYTDHFFGPGKWTGKAFRSIDGKKGEGYNIFSKKKDGTLVRNRTRKIDTHVGPSVFDENNSYHLIYGKYNSFPVDSMCDELRRVNKNIYVGLGYMAAGGGSINPSPFIVYGEPGPWVSVE